MSQVKPNVIYIYADDLGRGMLSCYGQKHFETKNIDKLCNGGMQFHNAYGCHMCAPARASFLCGIHDSHAGRWTFTKAGIYLEYAKGKLSLEDVYELIHNTGIEQRSEDMYLPMVFGQAGYFTGQVGKLEWGFATTGDEIKAHGWDYHFGYYDHQMCHGYYPPFLFEDGNKIDISGNSDPDCGKGFNFSHPKYQEYLNDMSDKKTYSQDLFDEAIVEFITKNKDKPFFLYHPSQLPHGMLSVPEIDKRVLNNSELNTSEKIYASMILRLDNTVGLIVSTLEKLNLTENTMIIFAADNGHCFYYGEERNGFGIHKTTEGKPIDHIDVLYTSVSAGDIFDGNNGMTGCKLSNFEGGARIPLVVNWENHIKSGTHTDRMVANYDFMATMSDLLGINIGNNKDGLSYLNILLGQEDKFKEHDYVVFASENGPALVTKEGFKIRSYIHGNYKYSVFGGSWSELKDAVEFELYNIREDYMEQNNLAKLYPDKLKELKKALINECDGNVINGTTQPHFAFYGQ